MENTTAWITSCKTQEQGFLVNGTMSVPLAEGNVDYQMVQAWIAEGNTPEPDFTKAEIAANAQQVINQEALAYLSSTDWQLRRHGDEILSAVLPSLTDGELSLLLQKRADARLAIV